MSDLASGTHMYIYAYQMTECENKPATAKANFFTNCFYKKFEQTGMNVTGANDKKQMDPEICNAIVCKYLYFCVIHFCFKRGDVLMVNLIQ